MAINIGDEGAMELSGSAPITVTMPPCNECTNEIFVFCNKAVDDTHILTASLEPTGTQAFVDIDPDPPHKVNVYGSQITMGGCVAIVRSGSYFQVIARSGSYTIGGS